MDVETSKQFLRCLGVNQFSNRTGWVTCSCPLKPWNHQDGSGKASFGLKTGSGKVFVKCLSCDYHGTPEDLVYEIRTLNKLAPSGKKYEFGQAISILAANPAPLIDKTKSIDELTYGNKIDFEFPEEWLAEFEPAFAEGQVHPYLASRQMPFEVAKALDLRWDNAAQRVCFPVRDYNGLLKGLHGRSVHEHVELRYLMYTIKDQEGEKRCNPHVWLGEFWVDPDRPVVLTESVFDLARVFEVYRNVMCPLMASLNEAKLKRLTGVQSIVTMFDADKAGQHARDKIATRFPSVPMYHAAVPAPFKDPSAMTVSQVAAILEEYVELDAQLLAS